MLTQEQKEQAETRINALKTDIMSAKTVNEIVQKHLIQPYPIIFPEETHNSLCREIATNFGINPHDCVLVGSSKLGYSVKPARQWGFFNDESDVDIALVSDKLFDQVWKEALRYSESGGYWPSKNIFTKYLFQGWIRPDKFPPDSDYGFAKQWWEFYNNLSAKPEYGLPIKAGIYRDINFLEIYQSRCIQYCRTVEETNR